MTTEMAWTHERDDDLRRLIYTETASQAALSLSLALNRPITKNMVIGRCWRAGIEFPPARRKKAFKPAEPTPNPFPASSGCLWPHGDPGEPGFHFCGAHRLPDKPYCPWHAGVAYRQPADAIEVA
jgi:GcrA cell cycle regulator